MRTGPSFRNDLAFSDVSPCVENTDDLPAFLLRCAADCRRAANAAATSEIKQECEKRAEAYEEMADWAQRLKLPYKI
jgi:hypothetical protein